MRIASLALAVLLVLPACRRNRPALDEAQELVGSSGLKVEGFQPIQSTALSAKECRQGKAEGLDVLICAYGSADARARGTKAAESWIGGAVTGSVASRDLPEGRDSRFLLLAVADRTRADLSGKNIQKVVGAFSKE